MNDIIKCPQCDIPICIPKSCLFISKKKVIDAIEKVSSKKLALLSKRALYEELGIEHGK